jgi:hypothetical protein
MLTYLASNILCVANKQAEAAEQRNAFIFFFDQSICLQNTNICVLFVSKYTYLYVVLVSCRGQHMKKKLKTGIEPFDGRARNKPCCRWPL